MRRGVPRPSHPVAAGTALALALGGCGWVDSTGVQPGEEGAGAGGGGVAALPDGGSPELAGTDVALDEVAPGEGVGLLEAAQATLRLRAADRLDDDGLPLRFAWVQSPTSEGALEACAAIDGFDPARAPGTLADACTDPADCAFSFEPAQGSEDGLADAAGEVAFELRVPRLRAPAGRRHALVGTGPDGDERYRREFDLCLIAINEAPTAVDDVYETSRGGRIEIGPEAGVLANDRDDVDTGNAPLAASVGPLDGPSRAAFFELRPDGGFTWEPLPSPDGQGAEDRFRYEVTDGVHVASASVTLRAAAAGNRAPVALEGAPPVVLRAGQFAFVDLSGRLSDPDGDALDYAFAEPLPGDGALGLSPGGLLSGVPGIDDAGEYALTLVADDGTDAVGAPLLLVIESAFADAVPAPEAVPGGIFDQSLRLGQNIAAVRPRFEGGAPPLTFESGGEPLPLGVAVDPDTGRVAGRPRRTGAFEGLSVRVRDANGAEAVSAAFAIRVR